QGQGRDDGVDAAAVGQPTIDHRACLIDAPAGLPDHALDDVQQVALVGEADGGHFQHAVPLDVDRAVAVDQDVRDGRVAHQGRERPQAERLVQYLVDQPFALPAVEQVG